MRDFPGKYTALKQDDGEDGITWHLLQVTEMYIRWE